jgi:hypothetical protein
LFESENFFLMQMNSLFKGLIRGMNANTRSRITKPVQDHTNGILLLNVGKVISLMSDLVQLGIQLLVSFTKRMDLLLKLMNQTLLSKEHRGFVDLHY